MSTAGARLNFDDVPDVPTKLVKKAVRASDLNKDSRHIMHVLAEIADYKTSELPPKYTPSTAQLARETGMSESTVIRRRKELIAAGWLACKHPTTAERARHVAIQYKLAIPAVGAHQDYAAAAARLAADLAEAAGIQIEGRRGFTVNPPEGSVWTPGEVSDSHLDDLSHSDLAEDRPVSVTGRDLSDSHLATCQPDTSKNYLLDLHALQKPPAAAGDLEREQRLKIAEELTESFWRRYGDGSAQRRPAVRAVIITAVADNAVPRNVVAAALHRLAENGKQITGDSLTTALARLRAEDQARAAPSTPRPERRTCPVPAHSAVELTAAGLCPSCAADAKAGVRDEFDEPPSFAHIPTPRRALHAVPPPEHESRSA